MLQGKKWGTALLLTAMLVINMLAIAVSPAAAFTDIKAGTNVDTYTKYISSKNLMTGYSDGSFKPDQAITRAELATILVKAKGLKLYKPAKPTFKDVKPGNWAYSYVETVYKAGLLKGYKDKFRPAAKATRAELSNTLLNMTKESEPKTDLPQNIKDVKNTHWAKNKIAVAIDANIVQPINAQSFAPNRNATRADTARGLAVVMNTAPEYTKSALPITLKKITGTVTYQEHNQPGINITESRLCSTGATITTGENSEAQLSFPDGSNILMKAKTQVIIKESRGQSYLKQDGTQGTTVDFLEVSLTRGRIFGAMATSYFFGQSENNTDTGQKKVKNSQPAVKAAASSKPAANTLPWWKQSSSKRERMKVNMPWGVAAVRGCFWSNAITDEGQITSVVEGGSDDVTETSAGQSVYLGTGKFAKITSANVPPTQPAPLSSEEKRVWQEERAWVNDSAQNIQANAPAEYAAPTMAGETYQGTGQISAQINVVQEIMDSYTESVSSNNSDSENSSGSPSSGGGDSGGGGGDSGGGGGGGDSDDRVGDPLGTPVKIKTGKPVTFKNGVKLDFGSLTISDSATVTATEVASRGIAGDNLGDAIVAGKVMNFTFTDMPDSFPAEISIPLNSSADRSLGIFYYNGSGWEYQDTTINNGIATAAVSHFSTYGVLSAKQTAKPTASPAAGAVTSGTAIVLASETSGASIYYTTDGTTPTRSSTLYKASSKPTVPDGSITIKAVAVKDNLRNSSVVQFNYTGTSSGDHSAPVYQSAALSADNQTVTLTFDEALVNNTADNTALKTAVTLSTDGGSTFHALATDDTVSISGSTLQVTFSAALTEDFNMVRIAANTLKDSYNNVLTSQITTGLLAENHTAAPELINTTNYSTPVPGSTVGTTRISSLTLPIGAAKWQVKVGPAAFPAPDLNSTVTGTADYTAGADIAATAGQHLLLLATDDTEKVKAYADIEIASDMILSAIDISGYFTDANFKQAVWEWLGNTGTPGSFTEQDLIDHSAGNSTLDVNSKTIASLAGLEYFQETGLKTLLCEDNQLTSLPDLPPSLTNLHCDGNQLTSLPTLPASLTYLYCDNNQVTSLPALPGSLSVLGSSRNQLTSLPSLPDNLTYLSCAINQITSLPTLPNSLIQLQFNDNQITNLPALPDSLTELYCDNNQITSLPTTLPDTLTNLYCSGNQLTSLPTLPVNLNGLYCYVNQLTNLPTLPDGLTDLSCGNNQLTNLPTLPDGLTDLSCGNNQLTSLPTLPASLAGLFCYNNQLTSIPTLPASLNDLQCHYNFLDVFNPGTSLYTMLSGFTGSKTITPQCRYYYIGSARTILSGETSQLAGSELPKQDSSDGSAWRTSEYGSISDFTFFSSNEGVATVDSNGLITAQSAGSCSIYARYKNIDSDFTAATIPVTVSDGGSPAPALKAGTNYSTPVPGSAIGTTRIDILKLGKYASSATKWQIKVMSGACAIPKRDGKIAGIDYRDYSVGTNIVISAGQHILLLATDDDGNIKGYADIKVTPDMIASAPRITRKQVPISLPGKIIAIPE
ncbi:MAG: S-layer homology domain-containing protein [Chitinophagales bacterium]